MTSQHPERAARQSMVERLTIILEAFPGRAARLRLDEITADTGLPRSTAHRILEQLVRLGWLKHTQGGYSLGQRAVQMGGEVSSHSELRSAAAPLLEDLHVKTRKVVHLGVLDFGEVVYLDKIGGAAAAGIPTRVGGRAPAYATALGKAMLAWVSPEEIETLLGDGLKARTSNTITDLMLLHEELRRIRSRHGLSFDRDECVPGISCVGAAIRGPEGVIGGVSLVGETRAGPLDWLAPEVLDAAKRTSLRLNPETSPDDMGSTVWSDGMMERILSLIDDDVLM